MDWKQALDIQMDTHKWQLTDHGTEYIAYFYDRFNTSQLSEIKTKLSLARHSRDYLYRADTMFITKDMQHVLLQAAHDLPIDVEFDEHIVLCRMGFCVMEEAIVGEDIQGNAVTINAVGWEIAPTLDEDMCIMIYFYSDVNDLRDSYNERWANEHRLRGLSVPPMVLVHFYPGFTGDKVPSTNAEVPASELVSSMLRLFVAMQYLAQQSIGEPMRMTPPRKVRKRADRWNPVDGQRYITLITLRRKSVKKEHNGDEPPIERTHRWIVRGHWRKQYYPSRKAHGWKYIYEHIKGPEDKPLIISERRVFNFRR